MSGNREGLELYIAINGVQRDEHFEYPEKVKRMKWYREAKEVLLVTGGKMVDGKLKEDTIKIK